MLGRDEGMATQVTGCCDQCKKWNTLSIFKSNVCTICIEKSKRRKPFRPSPNKSWKPMVKLVVNPGGVR